MRKIVVSFADGAGVYRQKMARLGESVKKFSDCDFIGFTEYYQVGSEHHKEIPYKFKAAAINRVMEMGYELIIWADSPVKAIRPLDQAFEYLEENGYFFFDNIGHPLGRWTNDKCLEYFSMSREEALQKKMIMASCMGFNVYETKELIQEYLDLADMLYPGSWKDHRHDQTVMSFLLDRDGYNILRGQDTFFAYTAHEGAVLEDGSKLHIADSVCLVSD